MSSDNNETPAISAESLEILNQYRQKVDAGEEDNPDIINAMKAIDMAGKIMNTVMSGNQIDPAFLKLMATDLEKKLSAPKEKERKVKKVKKLKRR